MLRQYSALLFLNKCQSLTSVKHATSSETCETLATKEHQDDFKHTACIGTCGGCSLQAAVHVENNCLTSTRGDMGCIALNKTDIALTLMMQGWHPILVAYVCASWLPSLHALHSSC